jgi:hypothetical protein
MQNTEWYKRLPQRWRNRFYLLSASEECQNSNCGTAVDYDQCLERDICAFDCRLVYVGMKRDAIVVRTVRIL